MRLRAVDISAWLVIVASGIVLPVSALAALMLLAGADGSASAGLVDTFLVVVAPPLAFVTGIGVLRRNRIAWCMLVVLLVLTAARFAWAWATANPETTHERTASGVLVTTIGSDPSTNLPALAACLLLLAPLLTRRARETFMPARPAAPARGDPVRPAADRTQGMPALYLVLAMLAGTAGGAGWMVVDGLRSDETWFPGARPSHARTVARADEPVSYWLSLGLYALVAGGALAGAAWLVRNAPGRGDRA